MRHPEALVVVILPLVDYYLTIWGARLAEQTYRRHFQLQTYELNPIWRSDVAKRRLFNPRHLALAIGLTAIVAFAGERGYLVAPWLYPFIVGIVAGAFIPIIAQHVGNIVIFSYLRQRPEELAGAVTISVRYSLIASIGASLPLLATLALAAWYAEAPVVYGMLAGASAILFARFTWLRRAERAGAKES